MAIKKCKECSNQISTKAKACPHCGAVLKKEIGCFRSIIIVILVIIIVGVIVHNNSPDKLTEPTVVKSSKPVESLPKINGNLSDFELVSEDAEKHFFFTVQVSNEEEREQTVYAVVYGKNDMFIPPRRSAWPAAGLLFNQAGTRRGRLSPLAISKNWNSRPGDTKGAEMVLKPNASKSIEGALPINDISLLEAWRGEPLDPRSIYNEVYLWIFSGNGKLIINQRYEID